MSPTQVSEGTERPRLRPAGERKEFFALTTTDDEVSDDSVIKRRQGIPDRQHR